MNLVVRMVMHMHLCSGVIMSPGSTSAAAAISELTAYSGSAYLYFYSDAAVNMSGFSIRYRFVMLLLLLPCVFMLVPFVVDLLLTNSTTIPQHIGPTEFELYVFMPSGGQLFSWTCVTPVLRLTVVKHLLT